MYLKQGYRLHNDKYQLLNVLGEGGFSLTYRGAWRTEVRGDLGKIPAFVPVCIKEYFFKDYCFRNPLTCFVETNSETGKEIFNKNKEKIIKEARILAEINHPNVVNVLEVFKQNNTVYIVMEFISGHSLKHEVEQNGVFTEEKLKKIIYLIGQALDYIHEKNILHLDVKPSNILLDQNNNPKLIDFGISKKYDLSNDQETSTALLAASKGYASIEQYDSEGIQMFSPCPDIYSFGATMYYLVTGQVPTESILRSTKGLQNPREINPDISENTENVILKAMALNASDRYQSVMALLLDLGFDPAIDKTDFSIASLPEYSEVTSNMSDEPYDFDAEDETQIHSFPFDTDKRKEEKYGWIYFIAPLLVSGIMAFIIFGNFWKQLPDETEIVQEQINNHSDTVSNNQVFISDTNRIDTVKPDPISNPVDNKPVETVETKQEASDRILKDAEDAYNQKNYIQSLELIDQAELYMITDDTKALRILNELEIEKNEIQKNMDLYDKHMKFGIFDVVTRKSDDLWGAIDDKGVVKIPCEYLSFTKYGGYGFFQKDDNSYDKYDQSGEPISRGINRIE